ncbi:hypothetical protein F5141DRAFT_1217509 [Pisolithus sp. B1]|nr:hypothetical protein F5141DRAFT_1217509 [Pisolithus sp. B1]
MLSSSFKSCIGMPSWTDEFLRQSLLAEDIIDVHFHLFSRRSKSRVLYPRMLNTNTALLKNSAKYFKDLFSSDSVPSHAIIFNVRTTDSIFDGLELDDYGYGSDSDLEDEDDGTTVRGDTEDALGLVFLLGRYVQILLEIIPFPSIKMAQTRAVRCHRGTIRIMACHQCPTEVAMSLSRTPRFRRGTPLSTICTQITITFSPLKSSGPRERERYSHTAKPRPQCSAKSMYSLATKLGIDKLRSQAFDSIRATVNESNLLQELACSFAGRYPDVLELELDLLAQKIASTPIVEGLPHLMRRIARKELSHGADIMIGLHTRILQKHYLPQQPTPIVLYGEEDYPKRSPSNPRLSSGGGRRMF